jgi:hypothetical protein
MQLSRTSHPALILGLLLVLGILFAGVLPSLGAPDISPPGSHVFLAVDQQAALTHATNLDQGEDDLLLFLPAKTKPQRYFYIPPGQLAVLKQKVQDNAPEWLTLKANVDTNLGIVDFDMCSPENIALVYLLTGDRKYAAAALKLVRISMTDDVQFDDYLYFGEHMSRAAILYNYCWDALTPAERTELVDYMDKWTYELWFNNQRGYYAVNDPGCNYHYSFLQGTAFAGFVLRQAGHPRTQTYLGILYDKINRPGGVMDYLNTRVRGGDWCEGANYGERSKCFFTSVFSLIASMEGVSYFTRSPFFTDMLLFAHYQLQPGNLYLYPGGDLSRDAQMPLNPYEREYVQTAVFWLPDSNARRLGQWYLENLIPAYTDIGGSKWRWLYYKDMLFKLSLPSVPQNTLPLSYHTLGPQWFTSRTGWDAGATCVSFSGAPEIQFSQGHQHHDTGSFTIWKQDWLAMDPHSLSPSGMPWQPGGHNMLNVEGSERRYVANVPGLTRCWDDPQLAYIQVNGTNLFIKYGDPTDVTLMNEWTREFVYLKPDTVVVYDRAVPKPGSIYHLRFHFPVQPTLASGLYTASYHGGGISLQPLLSGAGSILSDIDLGEDKSCTAWRVQQEPATPQVGRFLNVLQVASGAPPALSAVHLTTTTHTMEGALWNNDVVMFSTSALGGPPALPFSYTLPGAGARTHTLLNMTGSCDVAVNRAGGQTTVTVSAGATYSPNGQGVLRFTQ